MDFDISTGYKELNLRKSVHPEVLKEETGDYRLIRGYVYIMSKKFKAFPEDPERLLLKIGFSDFATDDGKDKFLARLNSHKTSLISFKLWRLYLFDEGESATKKGRAYDAEQLLQQMITDTYNPPQVRITFDQRGMNVEKPRPTEWFWIKGNERNLNKVLDWMDTVVFTKIPYLAIHGTKFFGNGARDFTMINPKVKYKDIISNRYTRMEVDPSKGTVQERKELTRISKSDYAKVPDQKELQLDRIAKDREREKQKKLIKAEGRRLARTVAYWNAPVSKGGLRGMKFYDKDMGDDGYGRKDDGKFPNKKVTEVRTWKRGQYLVYYTIDATDRQLLKISGEDLDFYGGSIPLHEFMDIKDKKIAKYKKDHDEAYQYFKQKFNYDPEVTLVDD
tara:strand:+ start:715 stop:1887 length:1173 start_codon:yes stop_codon:yes gene_type:complete